MRSLLAPAKVLIAGITMTLLNATCSSDVQESKSLNLNATAPKFIYNGRGACVDVNGNKGYNPVPQNTSNGAECISFSLNGGDLLSGNFRGTNFGQGSFSFGFIQDADLSGADLSRVTFNSRGLGSVSITNVVVDPYTKLPAKCLLDPVTGRLKIITSVTKISCKL
jgi:hypothetical protein